MYPTSASYPPVVERECCSASEFLFTGRASGNKSKEYYEGVMLFADFVVVLNNIRA
jgi:hypothetical protein